jgi:mannose-6-phosphate isomerase-like protein (cupin superfamily)
VIIRRNELAEDEARGRTPYPIGEGQDLLHHLSAYHTTPDKPFPPHKHERPEIWYIIEGEAVVSLDGAEHRVGAGDVVVLNPWVDHGLRSESEARWLCLG